MSPKWYDNIVLYGKCFIWASSISLWSDVLLLTIFSITSCGFKKISYHCNWTSGIYFFDNLRKSSKLINHFHCMNTYCELQFLPSYKYLFWPMASLCECLYELVVERWWFSPPPKRTSMFDLFSFKVVSNNTKCRHQLIL